MGEKSIPRQRVNRHDIDRIFGLFAGLQEYEQAAQEMEKRFRTIPNGWRDLRLVIAKMNSLCDGVMATVPPEKLTSMQRMTPRMKFKVVCGPQASDAKGNECTILLDDADVLTEWAHKNCEICIDGDCSKCALGRTLDSIMTYDRDGRTWAGVDLAALRRDRDKEGAKC